MPFDYEDYQKKCDALSAEELHREWENYTRQISGGATSTATSVLFSPFTAGISLVGIGLSAPRIHNARKKREIIQAGLEARGETHNTRKRDVIAPLAVAGTLSSLTLGLAGPGADLIAGAAVGHGAEYVAAHVALDSTGAVLENKHDKHSHKKAHQKLQAQYQSFQKLHGQQQEKPTAMPLLPSSPVSQIGGLPTSQTQLSAQDQKQEYVPFATLQRPSSYQPTSHQQNLVEPAAQTPVPMFQPPPLYSPSHIPRPLSVASAVVPPYEALSFSSPTDSTSILNVQGPPGISSPDTHFSPVLGTPAPVTTSLQTLHKLNSESDAPIHITVFELDSQPAVANQQDVDSPVPELTMEQEIAILKARILQMEIEKREEPINNSSPDVEQPSLQTPEVRSEISQVQLGPLEPDLRITPAMASFVEHQNYFQPPASPAMPSITSPIVPLLQFPVEPPVQSGLSNQAFPFIPPPPPPRPHSAHIPQYYPPPPTPLVPTPGNNMQNSSAPPLPFRPQQHPEIQRQDSGYYSNPPSRHQSSFSTATISTCSSPQQLLSPRLSGHSLLAPQSPGQSYHGLRHSVSYSSISSNQASPMSSQPSPYFPPPPTSTTRPVSQGKDYFTQNYTPPPPQIPVYQPGMGQPAYAPQHYCQGSQGWQWEMAPTTSQGEPNYGAPPAIPAAWKRS